MITILKEGHIPSSSEDEPRYFIASCTHCHTEFTFAFEDCEGDLEGLYENLMIRCPICKRAYGLKSENVLPITIAFYKKLMEENKSH